MDDGFVRCEAVNKSGSRCSHGVWEDTAPACMRCGAVLCKTHARYTVFGGFLRVAVCSRCLTLRVSKAEVISALRRGGLSESSPLPR